MVSTGCLDNKFEEPGIVLGTRGMLSAGEFYKQVAHTPEKGNSVIPRHLSIPNTVAIAFVSSESQRDGSAKGRDRYRGDGWFESVG